MLQYFYDPESGIVDISLRCRLYRTQVKSNAEEGTVAISTLIVDDPAGDITFDPFRQIYIVETDSPSGEQVVYRGYIVDREVRRGPYRTGAGREWVLSLSDPNWLINLRIVVGSDANRPAETDLQRVQWLLTTTEANTFNGDDTYVNTSATTVAMDAADYRGQNVSSILDDCAQATGKNWWVVYFEAIGQYGLWYDFAAEPVYDSPISLSNDLGDVDNLTVFAISQENTTLELSPSRLVSGVFLPYDGGNVYVQNPVVGSNFIFRDAAAPSVNVKTLAKATARANRYLVDNATEEHVIRTEVILPAAQVNDIMHGMRIQTKATHLPGYEANTWMRALNRTVTETSEEFLTVGLELSPFGVTEMCTDGECQRFDTGYNVTIPDCVADGDVLVTIFSGRTDSTGQSVGPDAWTQAAAVNAYNAAQYPGPGPNTRVVVWYRTWSTGDSPTVQISGPGAGTQSQVVVLHGVSGIPTVTSGTLNTTVNDNISIGPTAGGGTLVGVFGFQRNDAFQQNDGFAVNPTGDTVTVSPAGATHEEICGVTWSPRRWIGMVEGASALTLTGTMADPGNQETLWATSWVGLYFA